MLHFKLAAKAGNKKAYRRLGYMYEVGYGDAKNQNIAIKYYQLAIEQGDHYSMHNLANIYFSRKEYKQAFKYYSKSILKSDYSAYDLGILYEFGLGAEKNMGAALKLYKKSISSGDVRGFLRMGVMYLEGIGLKRDEKKGHSFIRKALKNNSCVSYGILGDIYQEYYETDTTNKKEFYQKAIHWYKKLPDNSKAMNKIGILYSKTKNYNKAIYWYKKAIKFGSRKAVKNMALFYETRKDTQKALRWYKEAAKIYPELFLNIAYLYHINRDYKNALLWYEKAIEREDTTAMINAGYIHENRKNYTKALKYYEKALHKGNKKAEARIQKLLNQHFFAKFTASSKSTTNALGCPLKNPLNPILTVFVLLIVACILTSFFVSRSSSKTREFV